MDSGNYFGEANMGNIERPSGSSSSSSNSSRKGKKNNQHKPKQPQRGLGVAQLERIRLHDQMAYGYHPPYPSNFNNEDPRVQTLYSSSVPSSSFSYSSPSSTSYSASYGFHSNIAIGIPEYERTNSRYGDFQPSNTVRSWEHANASLQTHSSAEPNITRPLLHLHDIQHIDAKNHRSGSVGSSSQNSESSDNQEPDLELRLSL